MSSTLMRALRALVSTPASSKQEVSRTALAPSGLFSSFCDLRPRDRIKQKECAVLSLPKIALNASDYTRLEQLARVAAQNGDLDGIFLMGEINRADIISDGWGELASRVTVGSWVTFCMNWGDPSRTVRLVWPEEVRSDPAFISVLTPLGAALIGLQTGDQMPFFVAGCLKVIRVENVTKSDPKIVPLVRRASYRPGTPFDDDPGPTAA